ncbi:hypothetical protein ACRS5S_33325 [Nocardia asiatica]|uniref:hypothetical protein n=1 Tax=Nocardia asiatica TaxID=209252 RepID=UPI0024540D22|nr:hypothetical protein [Nocardia asiatica]
MPEYPQPTGTVLATVRTSIRTMISARPFHADPCPAVVTAGASRIAELCAESAGNPCPTTEAAMR